MSAPSSPRLLSLPAEIIDQILAFIDLVPDLTAFALASRECARHVIPRHTEYRVIQTTWPRFHVWAHLVQQTNLSRNIREVHMYDRHGNAFLDRFPSSLLSPQDFDPAASDAEAKYMRTIYNSLTSMDLLTTFVWSTKTPPRYPTKDFRWELALLEILASRSATLRRIYLGVGFARYTPAIIDDPQSIKYAGWRITNLTTLCLQGADWITPNNAPHLEHLLSRNRDLEHLDIPMEFTPLTKYHFPRLKRLKLTLTRGALMSIDRIHIQFFSQHPTIEDLVWYPVGNNMVLPPGILPNLKRLSTDVSFAEALYASKVPDSSTPTSEDDMEPQSPPLSVTPRRIECLNVRTIAPSMMEILEQTPHDRTSLRKLIIHVIRHDDLLGNISKLFPNIVYLQFPSFVIDSSSSQHLFFTMDGWLALLPQYQQLEVFRGSGIWETLHQSRGAIRYREAIERIVGVCPNLREFDDLKIDTQRGNVMRLLIRRQWVDENGNTGSNGDNNGAAFIMPNGASPCHPHRNGMNEEKGTSGDTDWNVNATEGNGVAEDMGSRKVLRVTYQRRRPKSVFDIFSGAFD
ncbi:hypothetical protein AX15_007428 [Amanita polypyramis BW_CC]|nr:hypothetical protein AX15_007428 [Amanita polypyramis BW_CC]